MIELSSEDDEEEEEEEDEGSEDDSDFEAPPPKSKAKARARPAAVKKAPAAKRAKIEVDSNPNTPGVWGCWLRALRLGSGLLVVTTGQGRHMWSVRRVKVCLGSVMYAGMHCPQPPIGYGVAFSWPGRQNRGRLVSVGLPLTGSHDDLGTVRSCPWLL